MGLGGRAGRCDGRVLRVVDRGTVAPASGSGEATPGVPLGLEAGAVIEPGALALFVRFVRMNPGLAPDDPLMVRALEAYCAPGLIHEPTRSDTGGPTR